MSHFVYFWYEQIFDLCEELQGCYFPVVGVDYLHHIEITAFLETLSSFQFLVLEQLHWEKVETELS